GQEQHEILAGRAVHLAARPGLAVARAVDAVAPVVRQRVASGGGLEDHRAAAAAVPSVGTAARHVLLASEGDAAISPGARSRHELDLVDEAHGISGSARSAGGAGGASLRVDGDEATVVADLEAHAALDLREQRVVTALADVAAGVEVRPDLADDDA